MYNLYIDASVEFADFILEIFYCNIPSEFNFVSLLVYHHVVNPNVNMTEVIKTNVQAD